ncbi:hypothetical protein [uncultured Fibrella sp.]|uniref:hypothetical protein n=1 Tax=uncultured Fibrella sp. TaxID=1284596 RepID=UPI0035CAC68C
MKLSLLLAGFTGLIPLLSQLDEHPKNDRKTPPQTLRQAVSFPIGFAVNPSRILETGPYRETVNWEGDSLTAEYLP